MKRPDRQLRAYFERHPTLDLIDRALGTPLHAFVFAAGVVMVLRIPGGLPRAFLLACLLLSLVAYVAIGWRDVLMDRARMKRRSAPDSS